MRNPPRTQQNSIFEPLFSQEEELPTPPTTHLIHSSSSEWLTSTYSAPPCVDKAHCNNQLRKAPTTIFSKEMSTNLATSERKCTELASELKCKEKCEPVSCDHGKPFSSSTNVLGRSMQSAPTRSRSLSSGNIDKHDDGSVASKLLTSITKSISSPSLLSCCKESVRETPYQKTLRLRMMKLQHCAEELGSESSDGALIYSNGGNNNTFDSFSTMNSYKSSSQLLTASSFARSPPSPIPQKDQRGESCDASPMMISVRSAPNLRCPSLVSRHTSHTRERSFPPPLTPTLARSTSADSFTFSLRAHREDGRFMLKEVKVPCRQYLQANRKDGRLTLQLFTSVDEDIEQGNFVPKKFEDAVDVQQDESVAEMCEGGISAASDKVEVVGCCYDDMPQVESANTVDFGGDAEGKESKDDDDVNMNEIEGNLCTVANSDVRKDGGLSAKSLLMAAINVRLEQCEENNMDLQSRLHRKTSDTKGSKSMLGVEISSTSLQGAGFVDMDRNLSSTIIFKDVGGSSLMENVTKLVSSFGLGGGKWCQRKGKSRELERSAFKSGEQLKGSSTVYNGITSINIGVRKLDKNGPHKVNGVHILDKNGQQYKATGAHILDVECESSNPPCTDASEKEGGRIDKNAGDLSTTTTLQFDVLLPLHFDWLHNNLHCKELSKRNYFANKGFPCVAIRS